MSGGVHHRGEVCKGIIVTVSITMTITINLTITIVVSASAGHSSQASGRTTWSAETAFKVNAPIQST